MKTRDVSAEIEPRSSSRLPVNRLTSIDVLRGITIAFMILVNDHIRNYAFAPLEHSKWNGCTPTDLVFPTFLFVVGISIVFSFQSRFARGTSKSSLLVHVFRRGIILFLIGLAIRAVGHANGENMRIYGVLQRIAVCYVIACILYLWDQRPGSQIAIVAAALVVYWILIRWVPIPGLGVPGRYFPLFDPTRNLGAYIDRHLFPGHLSRGLYDTEGLLGTLLPSTGTTLLGILTGTWLRSKSSPAMKAWSMLAAGVLGILLGLLWGHWFPINKQLWTSSYVLYSAGWALIALSIFYWAIEIKDWKKGWTYIWLVFGMNAITAYVISEFLGPVMNLIHVHMGNRTVGLKRYMATQFIMRIPSHHVASLAFSVTIVAICFVPVAILYRKKIFLKI